MEIIKIKEQSINAEESKFYKKILDSLGIVYEIEEIKKEQVDVPIYVLFEELDVRANNTLRSVTNDVTITLSTFIKQYSKRDILRVRNAYIKFNRRSVQEVWVRIKLRSSDESLKIKTKLLEMSSQDQKKNQHTMRKRFKEGRIASSDNYELSRKVYISYLKRCHIKNMEIITRISSEASIKQEKYVKVFGELIPISESELKVHSTLIIVEE